MALDHTRSRTGQHRTRRAPRPDDLDAFCRRLRACGATPDEIAATVTSWDDFSGDWTPAARAQMVRWSDGRIITELAAIRAEYHDHTDLP